MIIEGYTNQNEEENMIGKNPQMVADLKDDDDE